MTTNTELSVIEDRPGNHQRLMRNPVIWHIDQLESSFARMGLSICSSEQNELSGGFNAIPPSLQGQYDDSGATTQMRCSTNQKLQRRKFTDEFKKNAVQLVLNNGYSCTEVARRLNVNHTNVSRWVRQYRDQSEAPA